MWVGANSIFLSCCTRFVHGVRLGQSNCFVSNLIYLLSSMLLGFLVKLLPRTTPASRFNHRVRRPLPLLRIQTLDSTGICFMFARALRFLFFVCAVVENCLTF